MVDIFGNLSGLFRSDFCDNILIIIKNMLETADIQISAVSNIFLNLGSRNLQRFLDLFLSGSLSQE